MSKKNISYFKKIIKPTEEEKRNHDQYLKTNFKKNFFN
jgi:DNA polymerase-3 subunit epsilon